jgi:hypothetical protein
MVLVATILGDGSFASLACAGLLLAVVSLLVWTTLAQRDFWPFSHYPMFAAYRDAASARFFQLRFHLPDGRVVLLPEQAAMVASAFTQAFQERWPSPAAEDPRSRAEMVRAFWQKACRHEPALAAAVRIEIVLRAALIPRTGPVAVAEKTVLVVETAGWTAA